MINSHSENHLMIGFCHLYHTRVFTLVVYFSIVFHFTMNREY